MYSKIRPEPDYVPVYNTAIARRLFITKPANDVSGTSDFEESPVKRRGRTLQRLPEAKGGTAGFGFLLLVFFVLSAHGFSSAQELPLEKLRHPPGFSITTFATDLPDARSLARGDRGTIFVASRRLGKVRAVIDADGDFKADTVLTLMEDKFMPNGVAVHDGNLYVAEVDKIWRFDNVEESLFSAPQPVLVFDDLPHDSHHGWKYIAFGPDGYLYVPIGAPCNICNNTNRPYATICRIKPDGTDFGIFARGVRNTVGFDWNPSSGVLWFTDNGRDWLGDNSPPDELNRAPDAGSHFGYPFCHGGTILDPEYGSGYDCKDYVAPAKNLGPHVAALGMHFYRGKMFPDEYRHVIFIAEHGSWNRSTPIGYRITSVEVKDSAAVSYDVFIDGWLENGSKWGRPVDILELPDGSLLVSDDYAGAIYRISYAPPPEPSDQ
jgi:glucose/arabinose dehydrogenase